MKILVMSDTHGNVQYISALFDKFKGKIDLIIHLGDDSLDISTFEDKGTRIIKVPGIFENSYSVPETKRRIIEEIGGKKVLITHTDKKHTSDFQKEPGPEELSRKADIILYGHTHIPKITLDENKKVWVNPGHLKENDNRGSAPSYAIIDCEPNKFKIEIYDYCTGTMIDGIEI